MARTLASETETDEVEPAVDTPRATEIVIPPPSGAPTVAARSNAIRGPDDEDG
jgi:hypothetical protein